MCNHCKDHRNRRRNVYKTIRRQCELQALTKAINAYPSIKETLKTADPLTVFGPNNRAFEKVPECGTLDEILLYHVVPEYLSTRRLENNKLYPTLREGKTVRVNVYERPVFNDVITVNGAKVVDANLKATNGVVHEINKVLCPPTQTLYQIAATNPDLSVLAEAVDAAGLEPVLNDPALSFTVFAPTNEAFEKLAASLGITLQELLAFLVDNPEALTSILLYHVLGAPVFSAAIKKGLTYDIKTLNEDTIDILRCRCEPLKVKDNLGRKAAVLVKDVLAINGVAHVIDKVLLPFEVAL